MGVQIPYENTLGGFEMFNTGITDLAPELVGWYGAPGIVVGDASACNANCSAANTAETGGNGNGNGNGGYGNGNGGYDLFGSPSRRDQQPYGSFGMPC